jgi:hypothetical protein
MQLYREEQKRLSKQLLLPKTSVQEYFLRSILKMRVNAGLQIREKT